MRLVISRDRVCIDQGSTRCERCFPNIVEMKRDGVCILEQEDDGVDIVTLIVVHDNKRETYVLTQAQIIPLLGESWETIETGIAPFRINLFV